jgi:hypothetical protein
MEKWWCLSAWRSLKRSGTCFFLFVFLSLDRSPPPLFAIFICVALYTIFDNEGIFTWISWDIAIR